MSRVASRVQSWSCSCAWHCARWVTHHCCVLLSCLLTTVQWSQCGTWAGAGTSGTWDQGSDHSPPGPAPHSALYQPLQIFHCNHCFRFHSYIWAGVSRSRSWMFCMIGHSLTEHLCTRIMKQCQIQDRDRSGWEWNWFENLIFQSQASSHPLIQINKF